MDHSSHQMTAHYARLADTAIREQWERAMKVNINGQALGGCGADRQCRAGRGHARLGKGDLPIEFGSIEVIVGAGMMVKRTLHARVVQAPLGLQAGRCVRVAAMPMRIGAFVLTAQDGPGGCSGPPAGDRWGSARVDRFRRLPGRRRCERFAAHQILERMR